MRNLISIGLILMILLGSCSVKRFIPEDESLYTGAELKLNVDLPKKELKGLQSELEALIKPDPNRKFLGSRFRLWSHYKGSKEKPGFINRFLKNQFGEEPVYFSQVNPERSISILLNRLENKGYFYGIADLERVDKKKFTSLNYSLNFGEAYRLAKFEVLGDSLGILQEIKSNMDKTLLVKGERLDLDILKNERSRIERVLKDKGYYNFGADLLIFEADTNQYEDRRFDLYLRLKSDVPEKAIYPYSINEITVFPNYVLNSEMLNADTVRVKGVDVIQEGVVFKPDLLVPYVLFKEGDKFDPQKSRLTANRLSAIGNFRYVNITFDESDSLKNEDGTLPLNANILLSPLNKRSIRAEIQAVTKSNSFVGPALILTYRNLNIFHGGEMFSLSTKVGYETQIAQGDRERLTSIELGAQAGVTFPRVIFPVPVMNRFQYAIPKTRISIGYEYQYRSDLYKINSYNTTFGYFWQVNRHVYHEFNPISHSIFDLRETTPEFEEILDQNPFLRRSFEQQFIFGMNYTFNYNQLVDAERKHPIFFGTTLDFAGNSLRLFNELLDTDNPDQVFGLEYAQYMRMDVDFRYYWRITRETNLVSRIFAGAGIPLGKSLSLPYVKQYFSGGPSSVRAFRIRALGPGTFIPEDVNTSGFFDQAGDIRLEGNMELRFPFNKYLKGAVFADAGNVWLYNDNEALPGGKFTDQWFKELGVGVGYGMRIDIQLFVLRFDLAIPIRKPWLPEDQRWLDSFQLGSRDWRRENMVLNFAIGYPF
ncbi:BamA/TamA family outer membrane protein [Shivajiella indica]|uniref:BamA/TamA family outer membrane protein n=1 Tax=Shivajiella indica TaxID=872115 RepID=A0ABW5B6L6_9BACT